MTARTLILAIAPFASAAPLLEPLAARRAAYPEEKITIAGCPALGEVAVALGLAAEDWEVPVPGESPTQGGSAFGFLSLLARARRGRFDAVVDVFPKLGSTLAAMVAGRPGSASVRRLERIGSGRSRGVSGVEAAMRLSAALGVAGIEARVDVAVDPEADAWMERALTAIGYRGGGAVLTMHTRGEWPLERLVEVGDRARSAFHAWLVALDAPKSNRRAKAVAAAIGGGVLGVGAPTGARFLASVSRSSLVVTDDPGVAYVAGLAHVPSVLVAASTAIVPDIANGAVVSDVRVADVQADAVLDAVGSLLGRPRTGSLFAR